MVDQIACPSTFYWLPTIPQDFLINIEVNKICRNFDLPNVNRFQNNEMWDFVCFVDPDQSVKRRFVGIFEIFLNLVNFAN